MSFAITEEMKALLRKAGSNNKPESIAATQELGLAFTGPLREGILDGDILFNIFQPIQLEKGAVSEFELSFINPGSEKDFVAYTIPNQGRIPERHVEGDYVQVNTYDIGAAIDMLRKYARDSRFDVVGQAMDALNKSFIKKKNDDGWHTLIAAGVDRNVLVFDPDASNGVFSKRLVSSMKIITRRNGGGNSSSVNRGELTDLFMSPEAQEDIRNFGVDEVDEVTRRELIVNEGGLLTRLFQVNFHILDELGVGQDYQDYYTSDLGAAMPTGKQEVVVGLDLRNRDSFVMPIREALQIDADDTLHRQRRMGWYGTEELGFGCLDTRRVIVGAI